ncbi:MAG: 3-hydroxyacyl-CoA dehydrogenase [Candidatus Eremiobacteraeota bacterium]|nr:3-hydroxyacyl-CoA dehydrogenase [Candidatus Eremiobacteraeota bacterium]
MNEAGIVGAGTMGTGIALAIAGAGLSAHVVDSSPEALARGRAAIEATYRSSVERGKLSRDEADARRARIAFSGDVSAFSGVELVIEAAFEDLTVKRSVFEKLGNVVRANALLATNTSSLDIDAVTGGVPHPERALGMHFFSPANVMKLIEIVRGAHTSDDTIRASLAFAERLGKVGVVVGNCDGFVGNRMLLRYRREAELLLERGATPAQVDAALERFGFAMGPFAVSVLAGLDIAYNSKRERNARGNGVRFRQSLIPDLLVESGRLGQKTGGGYYRYEPGRRERLSAAATDELIAAERRRLGLVPATIPDEEVVERCTLALINEGARILAEGIARRPADIDAVWRYGYGFPAARGGPMAYAASLDRGELLSRLRVFEQSDPAFWNAAVVERALEKEYPPSAAGSR